MKIKKLLLCSMFLAGIALCPELSTSQSVNQSRLDEGIGLFVVAAVIFGVFKNAPDKKEV